MSAPGSTKQKLPTIDRWSIAQSIPYMHAGVGGTPNSSWPFGYGYGVPGAAVSLDENGAARVHPNPLNLPR